ncbi:MAG: hypothetical protein ACP5II_03375 [Infirmifilum sp.]|jgi:hypothetical protein
MAERILDQRVVALSLLSVGVILLLSAYFGSILSTLDLGYLGLPFASENSVGSVLINSVVFLGLVLIGTLIIMVIIRSRRTHVLPVIMAGSILFSFWGILELILELVAPFPPGFEQWRELLAIGIPLLTAILILRPFSLVLLNLLLMLYGSMAGALFYAVLPPWSILSIAVTLAAYDLYSVFRGPLRRILESTVSGESARQEPPSSLRGAVVYIGGLALGMGDVLIYSMLSPLFLLYPSPSLIRWSLASLMLLAGFLLTLLMLRKRRFMPALPLPVTLSVIAYLATIMLFNIFP